MESRHDYFFLILLLSCVLLNLDTKLCKIKYNFICMKFFHINSEYCFSNTVHMSHLPHICLILISNSPQINIRTNFLEQSLTIVVNNRSCGFLL